MAKENNKKTYVAYSDYKGDSVLILAEANSMKELMAMIDNGEILSTDLENIKIGCY